MSAAPALADDFQHLLARADVRVDTGPGGVRDLRLAVDGGPVEMRSRLITSGGLLFVRGRNRAARDLVLRGTHEPPFVALHVALAGHAESTIDGLGAPLPSRAGDAELFVAGTAGNTVRLRAGVANEAFRIALDPAAVAALVARHPPLAVLTEAGFRSQPRPLAPLGRLLDRIDEIMDSAHLGPLRPLFLEACAVQLVTSALAGAACNGAAPSRLPRREIDRMLEARHHLLARLDDVPSLAELAALIGTNDFALKRNFKAVFGQPVHAFVLARRLDHARALLRDTDDSIKQIAAAVGYVHASHFSTAFRRAFGATPAGYRASVRGLRA